MANIKFHSDMSPQEQLTLMAEDAQFDLADDSDEGAGVVGLGKPLKVPKVFVSNDCIFNCAYCGCRASNDRQRYCHDPRKLARLSVDIAESAAKTPGIFITSSIVRNADYTQELIVETLRVIREELQYHGYVHAKIMPGADPELIWRAGRYANRLSVNIETVRSDGYARIDRQKTKQNILSPMGQIADMIWSEKQNQSRYGRRFATSQTTQLMAGSYGEDDRTIMNLSEALYRKYRLARVYYTPFQYVHPAKGYEELPFTDTPKWRVRRLYQADRLMQLYGFTPDEITPLEQPNLEESIDPKCSWALRHLDMFPVEVNTADYETLLRIPGIGLTYAKRILHTRRQCTITHAVLRKLGVSLARSIYFITCNGKYEGGPYLDQDGRLRMKMIQVEGKKTEDDLARNIQV